MLLLRKNLLCGELADAQEIVHLSLIRFVDEQELILRNEALEAHVAVILVREEGSRLLVCLAKHLDRLVQDV